MALDFNDAPRQPTFEDAAVRKARVEKALQARIRELVRYLYPKAVLGPRDARIGDTSGVRGESLSISLTADHTAGRWIDHATGEKGDVFTLYARAHNLDAHRDFASVLAECDAWAGGAPAPRAEVRHKVEAAKPAEPEPTRTLEAKYVYRDKAGKKICEVNRWALSNGKKTFAVPGGMPSPRPLYNLDRWHTSEAVVIVEGEKCADALTSIGVEATTLMGGANTTLEKTDLTPLAGKTVLLWPDHDAPGALLMDGLAGPLRAMGCTVRTLAPPAAKPDGWDAADAVAEGFDVVGFLKAPEAPARPVLPILDVPGLLSVPDPTWIIDGWVIDDGASVWYGPPKVYKTFNVLDMALSVACGVPWRGNAVVQQPVLYLLGEGMGTFKYRVHVWLQKRSEGRQAQFWTIPVGVPLSTPEGLTNALAAIDSLPMRPGLIVVDTLNRHFGPGDENSSQDMTRFVQAIDAIRAHTRAHIAVVHHSGKDAEKGARGSSALLGAVDNEFRITRTEGTQICRIECTAARHSDEPKPMTVELVKVEVVHAETGLVMSSLLPVLREDVEPEGDRVDIVKLILATLHAGPKTAAELAEYLDLSGGHLRKFLPEMERRKMIYASTLGKAKVYHLLQRDGSSKTADKSEGYDA
jgi:5S rRNA maturation endonuclease (ribonuclease M5)